MIVVGDQESPVFGCLRCDPDIMEGDGLGYITNRAEVSQSTTNTFTYTYDDIGQLTHVYTNGTLSSRYDYDALGRRTESRTESDGGMRSVASLISYNALGQVESTTDAATNTTTFVYDSVTGRRIKTTDALSQSTQTEYDNRGQVLATWGATYPVVYEYDDYGRMEAMYTYRGTNTITDYSSLTNLLGSMDKTTWLYDEATGLLTNKLDAAGQGASYEYDTAGRLTERVWARGEETDYSYDDLGQLTNINYSAANTPDISFTYDRLGRQTTITDAFGTRTNTYNTTNLLLVSESNPVGGGADPALTRQYDTLGRSSGISLGTNYVINYDYDSLGRFNSISSSVSSVQSVVNYSYLPDSDLLDGYTQGNLTVTRTYESNRDLIDSIENSWSNSTVSLYDYTNDKLGRRVKRIHSGSAFNLPDQIDYGYNARSEVITANSLSNTLYQYLYDYDLIGNRSVAEVGDLGVTNAYEANALNQYTEIENATSTNTPTYDVDGNMITNGVWTYQWNTENRLLLASNATVVVENTYDYMGRRVMKTVIDSSQGSTNTTSYTYDQWNMIRESEILNFPSQIQTNENSFVWGLDLSQTLQGAGGVGGLLSLHTSNATYRATYDANGNISEYIDSSDGTIAAHYEYDPFGNITSQNGTNPDDFAYNFSTKYEDHETGLLYYGFRFYNPQMGRWINRDPLEERGGFNLYSFVANAPVHLIDVLGRSIWDGGDLHTDQYGNDNYIPIDMDWDFDPNLPNPNHYPGTDIPLDPPWTDLPAVFANWINDNSGSIRCKVYRPGRNNGHMSHCVSTCIITAQDAVEGLLAAFATELPFVPDPQWGDFTANIAGLFNRAFQNGNNCIDRCKEDICCP